MGANTEEDAEKAFNYALADFGEELGLEFSHSGEMYSRSKEDALKICKHYQELVAFLASEPVLIEDEIKIFKDNYSNDHESAVSAIRDYYIMCNSYAELAYSPEGSLDSYAQSIEDYRKQISEETKRVELSK